MAATSDEAKVSDELRNMIARSAEWQSWTALSESLSKARVDITEIVTADIGTQPRARIGQGDGAEHESNTFASGQGGMASGRRVLTFFEVYNGSGAWETEEETFINHTGKVVSEILAADEGLVNVQIQQDGPVTRPDEVDEDDNQLVKKRYVVSFGIDGVSE